MAKPRAHIIMKRFLLLTTLTIIICVSGFALHHHNRVAGFINIFHEEDDQYHILRIQGFELEHPFFGLAFHLHFDSNLYEFDHYTLGDYFESGDTPLIMVSKYKDESKIIAGVSLKRGDLIHRRNGTFLNLYFHKKQDQTDPLSFKFEDGIYSTFNETRMDVENVVFGEM
ncbi:hypothetical protein KA005_06230 [bacterium]|nr:hypothetical protein [bacterium]